MLSKALPICSCDIRSKGVDLPKGNNADLAHRSTASCTPRSGNSQRENP